MHAALAAGANTLRWDVHVETPLHWATREGHVKAMEVLIQAAPKAMQLANYIGHMPLHVAAKENQAEAVSLLLSSGLPGVSDGDIDGCLPLHLAAAVEADEEVVLSLLAGWPSAASKRDLDGNLSLHLALEHGCASCSIERGSLPTSYALMLPEL